MNWAEDVCVKDKWLDQLFKLEPDHATYFKWLLKEQKRLVFDVVISHSHLRGCFKKWLEAPTSKLGAECPKARDEIVWILEFLAAEMEMHLIPAEDTAAVWKKGCEIRTKYFAAKAGSTKNAAGAHTTLQFLLAGQSDKKPSCGVHLASSVKSFKEPATLVFDRYLSWFGADCATAAPKRMHREYFAMAVKVAEHALRSKPLDLFLKWTQDAKRLEGGAPACPQVGKIENVARAFPLLRAEYCSDEAKAYPERDETGQKKVRRLIKRYFRAQCKKDPNFSPPEWDERGKKWKEEVVLKVESKKEEPPKKLKEEVVLKVESKKVEPPKKLVRQKKSGLPEVKPPVKPRKVPPLRAFKATPRGVLADEFVVQGDDSTPKGPPKSHVTPKGPPKSKAKQSKTPKGVLPDEFIVGSD